MKVTIIPPTPTDDAVQLTIGTRVMLGDQEIPGLTKVSVHFAADDFIKADLHMFCHMDDTQAEARFFVFSPFTGEPAPVKQITFMDGSVCDFTDPETFERQLVATTTLRSLSIEHQNL